MKKKIGEIYNKPIVIGDKNLMTKNEVHKDEISGGSSKEYDDLHSFLYYDDRIIRMDSVEAPLCALVADVMIQLLQSYPTTNSIVKVSNLEDIFGINVGNYVPLDAFLKGSCDSSIFYSFKGISIPKYVFPELLIIGSGFHSENDKMNIFDLMKLTFGGTEARDFIENIKTQPTITREEFFDLLK